MVFRDRQVPPCALAAGDSGIQVRGLPFYAGKQEAFFFPLVLTMSGVESQEPGILNILQHVVHFSTARIYPDPNTNSTPTGRHLSTVLCSHAAVLEKQQANWHFPAAHNPTWLKTGMRPG